MTGAATDKSLCCPEHAGKTQLKPLRVGIFWDKNTLKLDWKCAHFMSAGNAVKGMVGWLVVLMFQWRYLNKGCPLVSSCAIKYSANKEKPVLYLATLNYDWRLLAVGKNAWLDLQLKVLVTNVLMCLKSHFIFLFVCLHVDLFIALSSKATGQKSTTFQAHVKWGILFTKEINTYQYPCYKTKNRKF